MIKQEKDIKLLNQELMKLLGNQDPKVLEIIDEIKKLGISKKDNAIIGYAYYRYAYYYYFTAQDLRKFRKNVQEAIKYLLRSNDKEFLGGAYNLIAYDAQDQGNYDVAYAYYMLAVKTSEQAEDISLPGLLEANAGRLLVELGELKKGQAQLKSAIKRIKKFTSMHVYNYNMILTYTDIALASFLLKDVKEIEKVLKKIEKHHNESNKKEIELSRTYWLLTKVYYLLLIKNKTKLNEQLKDLLKFWKQLSSAELVGLIFEIESLCLYMLDNNYQDLAALVLDATKILEEEDNLSVALRYETLKVLLNQKRNNKKKLKESLFKQNEINKKLNDHLNEIRRYSLEFSDMIEAIAKERSMAMKENAILQIRANTDALTGLPNRNAMNTYLGKQFDEAEKNHTLFGIGIIDVDYFKEYNDKYGHQVGDECLRKIGKALAKFSNNPDIFIARYGGDEFVVGYFGLSDKEINDIIKQMQKQVAIETREFNNKVFEPVQISQGIFNKIPEGKNKLWDYLSIADRRLYSIKKR